MKSRRGRRNLVSRASDQTRLRGVAREIRRNHACTSTLISSPLFQYTVVHSLDVMAQVPANVPEGVVESRDVFPDEITKEDVRPYFRTIDCSLRVLGSQFRLDPGNLNDLERRSAQTSTDLRELLLDECFKQEKIKSWQQFVTVLQKPAVGQRSIVDEIRKKFSSVSRQVSMDSAAASISITATTPVSPLQSLSLTLMETSASYKTRSKGTMVKSLSALLYIIWQYRCTYWSWDDSLASDRLSLVVEADLPIK